MRAIVITNEDGQYETTLKEVDQADLPDGDVIVRVDYSTLNYKDSLALTGTSPVVRSFPMVPGIDLAGTVEDSSVSELKTGDRVVLNGWGVGEMHWGGFAQKARVASDWLVPLPKGLTTKQAMAIGTAGFTAMLCVLRLEELGVSPDDDVLVTGATGGVGSIAVTLLARLGHRVITSTGRMENEPYLRELGAAEVIPREELSGPGRPLGKQRWGCAVDTVGSHTLANVCAATKYGGVVAACGLAQDSDFPATVLPFILRGVTLAGIDSVYCPKERRLKAWERLTSDLDLSALDLITTEIGLSEVLAAAESQLAGGVRGRITVDVNL